MGCEAADSAEVAGRACSDECARRGSANFGRSGRVFATVAGVRPGGRSNSELSILGDGYGGLRRRAMRFAHGGMQITNGLTLAP